MTKWNQPPRTPSRQPGLGIGPATAATLALIFLFSGTTAGAVLPDKKTPLATVRENAAPAGHSKGKGHPPEKAALEKWRSAILHTPRPKKGCFTASFPNTQWQEIACTKPPNKRLVPALSGVSPLTVGEHSGDFAATSTTGSIAAVHGSFDLANGITSNADYTLQINTQPFTTSACSTSPMPSKCRGEAQFGYFSTGAIVIQYWLMEYGPPGTSCPSPQGTSCASPGDDTGWCPVYYPTQNEIYCVANGHAASASSIPLTALDKVHLSGSAGISGTDEAVTFVDDASQTAYTASGSNYFPDLSSQWQWAEFNVFGNGNSSALQFNPGVTLIGRTTVEGTAASALTCDNRSHTLETNNLNMIGVTLAAPSIVFMESNGSGAPFVPPVESISPADGASNIPPWPAHFVWPIWPNETAWTIDIDTVDQFNSPNHRVLQGGTLDSLTHSASIDANLLAGKTYYWRVAGNAGGAQCPRFVHSFSTQSQQPSALAPASASSNVYPWQIVFSWKVPDGSQSFDWALTDPHHGSDSYTLSQHVDLVDCSLPSCKIVRDVAVNSTIHWSVQAHGPTDLYASNDGLEANAEMIKTSMPRAVIVNTKSDQNPKVNPWNIPVEWMKLPGASGYDLHVRDGLAGPESQVKHYSETDTHGISATIAHLDEQKAWILMRVFPIGPQISPQKGSSFRDEGDPDSRILINAGTQTVPCLLLPFNECYSNNFSSSAHVPYGSAATVDWLYAARATGYLVSWYPMTVAPTSGPQPIFTQSIVNFNAQESLSVLADGSLEQKLDLPASVFSPRLGAHTYGQWLSVRAQGPSELVGLPPEDQLSPVARTNGQAPYLQSGYANQKGEGPVYIDIPEVLIDDPPPQLATDSSGRVILENINGKSQFTVHWGQNPAIYGPERVEFALFDNKDCANNGAQPLPGADDIYTQPLIYSRHVRTYSFPFDFYDRDFSLLLAAPSVEGSVGTKAQCLNYHTAPPTCGNGILEGHEQCDEGATKNGKPESSCSGVCTLNQLVCGQPKYNQGGNEGYKGTISLGKPNASGVLYYNTLTIPDNIIVTVGGKEIWRSGCTGTEGYLQQPIYGDGTPLGNATIEVQTNCGSPNQGDTKWAFEVHCENDSNSTTLPPSEPKH